MFNNKMCHANSLFSLALLFLHARPRIIHPSHQQTALFFITVRTESCIVCCSLAECISLMLEHTQISAQIFRMK
jgi:hypothetical protein